MNTKKVEDVLARFDEQDAAYPLLEGGWLIMQRVEIRAISSHGGNTLVLLRDGRSHVLAGDWSDEEKEGK